jgi:lysophospholipase L1-like esterase
MNGVASTGDPIWVYTRWALSGGGTISDSQGNVYTQFRASDTYRSHRRAYWAQAKAAGVVTVSFSVTQQEILIISSPGYQANPDQVVFYPPVGTSGTLSVCPVSPLSITTSADSLLISDWVMDAQNGQSCTALSGTPVVPASCGGFSGMVTSQIATAGLHTQAFTFSPGFNAGNANCGMANFPKIAPPVTPGAWVFLGDSITANEFTVAAQWHTGGINSGVAGNTTQQMIDRFTPSVLNYHPFGVVILGGINDVNGLAGPTTAAAIAGRLTSMADTAIANGIQVVLCSILPLGAARAPTVAQQQMIQDVNTTLKSYVSGHAGTGFADYYRAMIGTDGYLQSGLTADGLHPNAAGYAVMYPITEAAITVPLPPPVPGCNVIAGDGIKTFCDGKTTEVSLDRGVALPDWPYMSALILGPVSTVSVPGSLHQIRPPCAVSGVIAYDNGTPRHPMQIDWTVDPATCDVVVNFASPQTNFYVVVR